MIDVNVKFFGAFRRYGSGMVLKLEAGSSVKQLRQELFTKLQKNSHEFGSLLSESAFADEKSILCDEAIIRDSCTVAVIPPVCGG
ncbi:MAG: MoaD/ThiS family protein [Bdellovibrionota bacterium]